MIVQTLTPTTHDLGQFQVRRVLVVLELHHGVVVILRRSPSETIRCVVVADDHYLFLGDARSTRS